MTEFQCCMIYIAFGNALV